MRKKAENCPFSFSLTVLGLLSCDERKLKDACSHNREKYDQVDHHNLVHVRRLAEDLRGNLTESCPLLEQVELFKHTLESVWLSRINGCYRLFIEAPEDVPLFHRKSIVICDTTMINFENEMRKLLGKPHGNCVCLWRDDQGLKPMLECYPDLEKYAYSADACRAFNQPSVHILLEKNLTAACVDQSSVIECPNQCSQTLIQITSVITVDDTLLAESYKDMHDTNNIHLVIGNPYLEAKTTNEMPLMTFGQLVGNIGGLLGLWLGASALTLVEMCELVSNLCHCFWVRFVKNKPDKVSTLDHTN